MEITTRVEMLLRALSLYQDDDYKLPIYDVKAT